MDQFLSRAHTLAATAVTYLLALAIGVSAAADEIATAAPDGGQTAVEWAIRAVAWIAAAVAVVRRVTPAPADQRGLLAPVETGDA